MADNFEVTLDNCAQEPIHIPGSIQSHGILLAVDTQSSSIVKVSANADQLGVRSPEVILNTPIQDLLGTDCWEKIEMAREKGELFKSNPFKFFPNNKMAGPYNVIASEHNDLLLLDLESTSLASKLEFGDFYRRVRDFIQDLTEVETDEQLFNASVQEIRKLTNIDRVMLYQFDEDYNGQVVAEDKIDELNSFLHQHFPESDIPAQARELYLRNPIRLIADVHSTPVPILPATSALDLTTSILRSVSPIHIQYLKNMGVGASMSISIVVEGRLWGLIACHHYSKFITPFEIREACVFLGQMLSYLITMRKRNVESKLEGELQALSAILVESMAQEIDFEEGLKKQVPSLLKMVNANGVAWNLTGRLEKYGTTPSDEEIISIINWLKSKPRGSEVHTNNLAGLEVAFEELSKVTSGILALPLSLANDLVMIWFRPEVIETKNWGGKPEKVIEFRDDGSHRLMPRSSFALWKQNVKHKSLPWQITEVSTALKFRNSLMNYVVAKSERLKQVNRQLEEKVVQRTEALEKEIAVRKKAERELSNALKEANRSNAELEQFAYVASHDLQEPLRKIQSFGERLSDRSKDLDSRSADYLERMIKASGRMQLLIQNLLTFSRITSREAEIEVLELKTIIDSVLGDLQMLIEEKNAKVSVQVQDSIKGNQGQIERLFQNLIQNAIKFNHPDRAPELDIRSMASEHTVTVEIKDNGIGFEPQYSEKIFGLFERLHGKSEYEGTGLGLAICKKIVERHNGTIRVESKPGKGSCFFIEFPAHY
ncbi:MAG: ATP-binding protein [Bacteroidota bacterium]